MMKAEGVSIFDSTLRDGAQGKGISFSVEDKLQIVRLLDRLGYRFCGEIRYPSGLRRAFEKPL